MKTVHVDVEIVQVDIQLTPPMHSPFTLTPFTPLNSSLKRLSPSNTVERIQYNQRSDERAPDPHCDALTALRAVFAASSGLRRSIETCWRLNQAASVP